MSLLVLAFSVACDLDSEARATRDLERKAQLQRESSRAWKTAHTIAEMPETDEAPSIDQINAWASYAEQCAMRRFERERLAAAQRVPVAELKAELAELRAELARRDAATPNDNEAA